MRFDADSVVDDDDDDDADDDDDDDDVDDDGWSHIPWPCDLVRPDSKCGLPKAFLPASQKLDHCDSFICRLVI